MGKPKQLNPSKWAGIMQLDEVMEAITIQTAMFEAHAENPGACPAVENYAEEFDLVIDTAQKTLDTISERVEPLMAELVLALEQFRHAKLSAMAACTKPTCPDKERAQQDLGWIGGDQILQ